MVIEAHSRVTLKRLATMARMLYRLRGLFLLGAVAAGIWLALVIADPDTRSVQALLPISLFLWMVIGLGIGYTLAFPPPAVTSGDGWRVRIRRRVGQAGYWLAAVVMLGLSVIALSLSLRALSLVF